MSNEICDTQPCRKSLPFNSVVVKPSSSALGLIKDCSTRLIYATDDAGLMSVANAETDDTPFLSAENRTATLASVNQLEFFYKRCSRLYFEISRLFSKPASPLVRPSSITLMYVDFANETIADVLDEVMGCDRCFSAISHTAYDINGLPVYDNEQQQLSLAQWATDNEVLTFLPTADVDNLTLPTESASLAYQSKQLGHSHAVYVLLNEECPYELDDDCTPTENQTTAMGMQHLLAAGVVTSKSTNSDSLVFNFKFKPKGGLPFTNVSTADLSAPETAIITGEAEDGSGLLTTSPHHVNVYHNLGGSYNVFVSGFTATGMPIDKLVYKRYIYENLSAKIVELLVNSDAVSSEELTAISGALLTEITKYVSQGIIDNTTDALDKSQFEAGSIFSEGQGWALLMQPNPSENKRISPQFFFCYKDPELADYISISLCDN